VANHFPIPGAVHVAALQHVVTVATISDVHGRSTFPQTTLPLVRYFFDTGFDQNGHITFSYAGFDQDLAEYLIRGVLNGLAADIASQLDGIPPAMVQQAMSAIRVYELEANAPSADGSLPVFHVRESLPYPATPSDSDTSLGIDAELTLTEE
jgi:hypothetical protein